MTTVANPTNTKPATLTASDDLIQQVKAAVRAAADAAAATRMVAADLALVVEAARRQAEQKPRRFGLLLNRRK